MVDIEGREGDGECGLGFCEGEEWCEDYAEEGNDLHLHLPPECRRVTSIKTSFNLYKRIGSIRFLRAVEWEDGTKFVEGDRDIIWREKIEDEALLGNVGTRLFGSKHLTD